MQHPDISKCFVKFFILSNPISVIVLTSRRKTDVGSDWTEIGYFVLSVYLTPAHQSGNDLIR